MAGDWIKVEHATVDKPEVLEMADILEVSADDVLGKLVRVWVWFDNQSRDGHAGNVTGVTLAKFIDRLVARPGFAETMRKVGWLTDSGIPNFERHNGETAKIRALARDRKAKERSQECHDENVTREEKRREEKTTPIPPGFARFWLAWPSNDRKGGKPRCLDLWKRRGLEAQCEAILAHVGRMKSSRGWTKDDGQFIPAPAVYLNKAAWDGSEDGAPDPFEGIVR